MNICVRAMELYGRKQPFALIILPGQDGRLYDFTSMEEGTLEFGNVRITPWKYDAPVGQYAEESFVSTEKEIYLETVTALKESFVDDTHKTVLVRKIAGTVPEYFHNPNTFGQRLEAYFSKMPGVLRFMFYTPESGLWLGSTPELLMECEKGGMIRTQALAGTRPAAMAGKEWDSKNMREHNIVVDDMKRRLEKYWTVEASAPATLSYGPVEHLCTRLQVLAGMEETDRAIELVHPTPAICGFPVEAALNNIRRFERFPREYYTGIINVKELERHTAYVVLRCAHVQAGMYEIFSGSGIIGSSDPTDEWNETQAKALPLIELFSE